MLLSYEKQYGYNNPYIAYMDGEKPISKWLKDDILAEIRKCSLRCSYDELAKLPLTELKKRFLKWKSAKYVNSRKVDFFVLDSDKVSKVTDSDLALFRASMSVSKTEPKEETWKCSFLEWYGNQMTGLTCVKRVEVGTIKGIWFYRANGTKKKVTSKGFEMLEKVA